MNTNTNTTTTTTTTTTPDQYQTHDQLNHPHQHQQQPPPPPPSSSLPSDPAQLPSNTENVPAADAEKWGTHIMGPPGIPASHPNNQKAALWSAEDHHPYVQHSPIEKPSNSPMESVVDIFNSWTHKTETLARNIWQNLKTGNSVSEVAWGKLGLTAKAISGGGFEALYKQTFATQPNEKLKRTFACYLSTTTGPVAGTLYLSNIHVAFCSDRPLCFTAPSGQEAWSYYKVVIPLGKISAMNPVSMRENPSEKYIQINTVDGHDFWFMGFVNYEKALVHLTDSFSEFVAHQLAAQPQPQPQPQPYVVG